MKSRNLKLQSLCLVAALCAGTVAAAESSGSQSKDQSSTYGKSSGQMTAGSQSDCQWKKLRDAKVMSNTGEKLGKVEDLAVDPASGKINFALIGTGGFLGIGEKWVAVPWKSLNFSSENEFTLNTTKDQLKSAPTVSKNLSELNDPQFVSRIDQLFGGQSAIGGSSTTPGGTTSGQGSRSSSSGGGSSKY